jgi:hypothetical protein
MPLPPPSASAHRSTLATERDIGSQSLDNIWQNGGKSETIIWTGQDRDVNAVNPKDLL